MSCCQESVFFGAPAAPGNAATATIFNSITAFGANQMRTLGLSMLEVTWHLLDQASATNGFKAYTSNNGSTWTQTDLKDDSGTATMPVTVAALSSTQIQYRFPVSGFKDFKLEWTAGATGPTASTGWQLTVVGHFGATAVQR